MKVKVTKPFCDKFNLTRSYNPGEVVDFEQQRAEDIVNRGLGEPFTEPKVVVESEPKKTGRKPKKKVE